MRRRTRSTTMGNILNPYRSVNNCETSKSVNTSGKGSSVKMSFIRC